jgi:hypothetical protein
MVQIKECDKAIWWGSSSGKFSCAATWEQLRGKKRKTRVGGNSSGPTMLPQSTGL